MTDCSDCDGTGSVWGEEETMLGEPCMSRCQRCGGLGRVITFRAKRNA